MENIPKWYRAYVLVLLTAVYSVNYIDRQVLSVVLELIKDEFQVNDTSLGLLAGPAFALFYATMGVPIAIAADRVSRARIIAASLAFFSLMTVVCGFVTRFGQLLVARMLTGVGEAGTGPSSHSIISDFYPPERRATALAIYGTGVNVGLMLAFFFGGWIAEHYGWRAAFIAAGAPGLLLTILVLLTLREPARESKARMHTSAETGRALWVQTSYRYIVLGTSMSAFSGYGIAAFVPAFLMRSHDLDPSEVGVVLALTLGVGGGVGTLLAGVVADRMSKRDARWAMYVPMWAALIALPFWPVFILSDNIFLVIAASAVPLSLTAVFIGPCVSAIQTLAPARMRARASAMQLFIGNLIGLGLGPLAVGVASDLLRPAFGRDSLRFALATGVIASLLSVWCYWVASRTLRRDYERTAQLDSGEMKSTPG